MKKIRHFLDNPKKVMLAAGCTAAIISVGGISTVYASGVLAQSSGIGEENAKKFACADAGVLLTDAQNMQVEFDYERGQYVYEVEFFANGTEYEYWIKASDGAVVKKELELKDDWKKLEAKAPAQTTETGTAVKITVDQAKNTALADAKLDAGQVTFTKEKLDWEDSVPVYELEFVSGQTEYEYEIYAASGEIYSKSKETKSVAAAEPEKKTETSQKKDDGKQPTQQPKTEVKAEAKQAGDIGMEKAKEIALNHAAVSQVTFTKAKLDKEDGILVYEVEFVKDKVEYEYTIQAADGAILESDVEREDEDYDDNDWDDDDWDDDDDDWDDD